jgi:hypothetical protein
MGYIRAHWKGLSKRIILSLRVIVICACGLLSNPAKFLKFQYTTFHADVEKTHGLQF